MFTPPRFRRALRPLLVSAFVWLLLPATTLRGQPATGTIEGRAAHPATGEFLEGVRVTVEGTALATATDADGFYRLDGVPAGAARIRAFYTGLPPLVGSVTVGAGQTATHDLRFGSAPGSSVVKLDEFVVSTSREMSGAALAINEQRFAASLKNVVAVDEFGDVAESNVAEFLKFLPGVNIDYSGGNAREVSLNGVPGDYVPVTIAGFSLASAVGGGAGGTNRAVGLDQVSINNLSRVEVEFSPTPDSQGNALAGSVNMIPRSSFERARPQFNFSTYVLMRDNAKDWDRTPAPRHPTRKIHPGADFAYVAPVTRNFGFSLSGGFSRQYSGEPQIQNTWRGVQAVTNGNAYPHTPFGQPYLSAVLVRNSGKDTKRSSLGTTVDWRPGRHDRLAFSLQASTFDVLINHNALTFEVGRVAPGAFSLRHTQGTAGAGSVQVVSTGASRTNWTYMPSLTWRHDGPLWKAEAGYSYSRARNRHNTRRAGFFDTTTSRRTGLTVAYDDIFYLRPGVVTVTDTAGRPVDPYSLDTYVLTAATGEDRDTDDTRRTLYASLRRDWRGPVPVTVRAGLDFRDAVRDQRVDLPAYTHVGRDGVASATLTATTDDQAAPFLDPDFSRRPAPYGFPAFGGVSSEKVYEYFLANPATFTTNANTNYRAQVTDSKRATELVSAAYLRGDLSLLCNRLRLVGGVRLEQTNTAAEGPLSDPSRNVQRDAQGRPVLGSNGRPLPILPASDALGVSRLTYLDRGARTDKEYLRWFPSLNASYDLRENLVARASWSTSVGRPNFAQYSGGVTLPDPENPAPGDQITVSNVGIKPWSARSLNVRLEYYPAGVGQITVGAFRRDFENFFGSTTLESTPEFLANYNLNPDVYGQYPVVTQYNLDTTVRMQGLTVNYRQPLSFLPGWARGVTVFANGSAQRLIGPAASANFPGFIPRTAAWGLSLNRPKYSLRANWNYRSLQRRAAINSTATNGIEPGTFTWWSKRLYLDLNGEYIFYRRLAVFASLRNVGDAPDDIKVYGPSTPAVAHFRQRIAFGSLWMFGVKGTF